ncbi:hypothetical protein HY605_01655 [Candidatus Peregrinibacteria bacterium]|nr:hypothetical protein [Candidatus Peregrinibacteria bacterium]
MESVTSYNLEDLERTLVETAREKAKGIIQSAVHSAEEKARKEALETEKVRIHKETEGITGTLNGILQTVQRDKHIFMSQIEKEVVKLAVAIAGKVVKKEIVKDPAIAVENIKHALEIASKRSEIEILISPKDYELVDKYLPELKSDFMELANAKLIAEQTISQGGCIVRTKEGTIDADITTQLEEIERQLLLKD